MVADTFTQTLILIHTALLPISHDVEGLRQSLTEVGDHIGHTPHAPFERVRTLHFFRALIVDGSRLAMDWVYDGPLDAHLDGCSSQAVLQ